MTIAVLASKAWMPRKSSFSAPGGMEQDCQTYPLSSVRKIVPLVPEAHATPLPTLWMPRRSAVVLEVWSVHWVWPDVVAARSARSVKAVRMRISVRHWWGAEQTLRAREVVLSHPLRQKRRKGGAPCGAPDVYLWAIRKQAKRGYITKRGWRGES